MFLARARVLQSFAEVKASVLASNMLCALLQHSSSLDSCGLATVIYDQYSANCSAQSPRFFAAAYAHGSGGLNWLQL